MTNGLSALGVPFKENEKLADYTTFKVGGEARAVLFPRTRSELKRCVDFCGENPVIIGNGSNVLVSDDGYDGVVISTLKLRKIKLSGNILEAESGVRISEIIRTACENSLGGIEFATGIPATVGGLVAMNGGCFNKNVSDVVCFVKTDKTAYNNAQCEFSYRSSRFLHEPIYSVGLKLSVKEYESIDKKIELFTNLRKNKQPKGNSCGSVFLNDGFYAGKVIDEAGLKGYRIGGACVSKEHANFIINCGGTAADIYNLIRYIKSVVFEKTGISLCEEVRYIGKF